MRVAVYHNLPPGGALRVLCEFVGRSNTTHEYDFYTPDLGPLDGFAYARAGADRHDLAPHVRRSFRCSVLPTPAAKALAGRPWLLSAPWWMDRLHRRIAAAINGRDYDVVLVGSCSITHSPSLLRYLTAPSLYYMQEPRRRSFEAGYQARDAARPVVHRMAASAVERVLRAGDRAAVAAADRVVCNSCYSAESIQRAYGRDPTVCYLGIDSDVFDLGAAPTERTPSVVSVGAMEAVKGHHLAVQALALLAPESRPALDVVYERADPRYLQSLQALAAASAVELRLHTGIDDTALVTLYRRAIATVATARLEPFGLVPLESMACGTPVVAVREAGYRETVQDGANGYLVERSAADVAAALSRLLAGGLGRSTADIRRTVVPLWSWDAAVKRQLEQLAMTADLSRR